MNQDPHQTVEPARVYWGWISLVLVCIALVHGLTLHGHPGPSGDNAEFQYLGHVLGIPHPTGYPLYLLLTHFWTQFLPWGSLAFQVNLFSLGCGLGACLFLAGIARRMSLRGLPVAIALSFLASTAPWWNLCTVAEVYALHALLMAAVLYFFIAWHHSDRDADFRAGVLLYGLSFAHHLTTLLLLPALLLLVHRTGWRKALRPANLAWCALSVAVGASFYFYLWVRSDDPALVSVYFKIQNWRDFWGYVSGSQFQGSLAASATLLGHLGKAASLLWEVLRPWRYLVPLVLLGVPYLLYTDRAVTGPLLLYFLSHFLFMAFYRIPDIADYALPLLALGALLLAGTLHHLLVWVISPLTAPIAKRVFIGLAIATIGLQSRGAWATLINLREPRGNADALEIRSALLQHPTGLLVAPHWQQTNIVRYYLYGEGIASKGARTIELVPPDALARGGAGLREHLREWTTAARPVMVFTKPGALYDLEAALRAAGVETEIMSPHIQLVTRVPDDPH